MPFEYARAPSRSPGWKAAGIVAWDTVPVAGANDVIRTPERVAS